MTDWKKDFKGYINALDLPRDDYKGIMEYIDEAPSEERKKGRWMADNRYYYETMFVCSKCRESVLVPTRIGMPIWDFCPNCGADMRKEE